MLLSQFEYRFPTEDSCIDYFKDVRLKALGACPKCGHTEYYWLRGKQAFECKSCRHRIPLTKGTVMEHIPMRTWFYTMHLMTSIKQVLSAKEVQHQLHMLEFLLDGAKVRINIEKAKSFKKKYSKVVFLYEHAIN